MVKKELGRKAVSSQHQACAVDACSPEQRRECQKHAGTPFIIFSYFTSMDVVELPECTESPLEDSRGGGGSSYLRSLYKTAQPVTKEDSSS